MSVLEKATGLRRSSLYHHFPAGKLGMAEASMTQVEQQFAELMRSLANSNQDATQRLRTFAKALDGYYQGGRCGCLIASFSLAGTPAEIVTRVAGLVENWIKALAICYVDAGLARAHARLQAQSAVAQLQGALLLSQASKKTQYFKEALRFLVKISR